MEERVRQNVENSDYKEHVASIENLPDGQDYRSRKGLHMTSLGSDLSNTVCMTGSL